MEVPSSISSSSSIDFAQSSISKYEGLIDIPLSEKLIDALISLFNYFDIYAPRIPSVYEIVSIFRIFQLVGGALMAENSEVFNTGTLQYSVISYISILFHIVPLQYRHGNAYIILASLNSILIVFGVYLVITAITYRWTSKVSLISTKILSLFMAITPPLLLPVVAQYSGQILSAYIAGTFAVDAKNTFSLIISILVTASYLWIQIKAYSNTLIFRQCSFQSIDGSPQNKLLITTILVTFVSSLTTYFSTYPSAVMMILSIFFYLNSASTVFNCATFVKQRHQIMILGSSALGVILCIANIYSILSHHPWNILFFVLFIGASIVTFLCTEFYIHKRVHHELILFDEIFESGDIKLIKNKNKYKEYLATGFNYAHPLFTNFSIFKLAVEEWKDAIDIWALFAKFAAIYPENNDLFHFVVMNIANFNSKNHFAESTLSNAGYIMKIRETTLTPQLKSKISKLSKHFNKAKNRLRNIWDLILQGSANETSHAIKLAYETVEYCEREVDHLMTQYPNSRFALRQKLIFLSEILGDQFGAKEAADELVKMQRGIKIRGDSVHELALLSFPCMPEHCDDIDGSLKVSNTESESFNIDEAYGGDDINSEAIQTISKQIEKHKIPAIRFIYISTIVCWLFLVFSPLLILILTFNLFSSEIKKPLEFMKGIAYTRNILTMVTALVERYLLQELDDPKNSSRKLMGNLDLLPNFPMTSFGGFRTTKEILAYVASETAMANELMSNVISYKPNNEQISKVRELLYSNTINFSYYINNTYTKDSMTTVAEVSYMVANHAGKLAGFDHITTKIAIGSDALTATNNNNYPTVAMNSALEMIISFISRSNKNYKLTFLVVMICLIFMNAIAYPLIFVLQVRKLRQNRFEILHTLTALPKAVISAVSSSFSKLKDSTTTISMTSMTTTSNLDLELNRQEEGIIKFFSSISDGSSAVENEFVSLICIMLIIIFSCLSYFLSVNSYFNASNYVIHNCVNIDYLFGTVTYLFGVMARIFKVTLATYDDSFINTITNIDSEVASIRRILPNLVSYFEYVTLGGINKDEVPFSQLQDALNSASEEITCKNAISVPSNSLESVHCFSAAQQLYVATAFMKKYYAQMIEKQYPNPTDESFTNLWQFGPIELYQAFFKGAEEEIIPIISIGINREAKYQVSSSVSMIIITAILSLIIIIIAAREEKLLKFALSMFIRCPPMVILHDQNIMNLLSGNYTSKRDDSSARFIAFSNEIFNKLNDVIIVCQDETGKIQTVNSAFEEIFDLKGEDIVGKHIRDFFTRERFSCTDKLEKVLTQTANVVHTDKKGNKIYLEFSVSTICGRRIYSGRDQSQLVQHEKLIEEERKRSDAMLASILPPMLVPRVQAGEKNISFSVQSVTVLFLDVVEFTPWCGAHDAQYVMRMLNIMYKEFDAITNAHKTMTKIKCIGDCYMAAGGIFEEVNQPAVHAKEVVDFGTLVIKKLFEIDERENEKLRIRVGINTGGPIVAGVIGTEKPTFEILGPTINIAHEMENKGVPMKVHISRPVYELIYGQQFDIKERGEIDVKGGKMFTYIVEP